MTTYYWVGGNGTWNATNTGNWSTTSGGSGGAGIPTSVDDVVFDVGSGIGAGFQNVYFDGGVCRNFTAASVVGVSLYGQYSSPAVTVHGNWTDNQPGGFGYFWYFTPDVLFVSTTTGKTIATNYSLSATFNGVGGSWTATSNVNLGNLVCTNGTFSSNSYNIATNSVTYSGTGTFNLTLNSTVTVYNGNWNFGTTTGLTYNFSSSTITTQSGGGTFNGGGLNYSTVNLNVYGGSSVLIGNNTFGNLTIKDFVLLSNNQTVTGTFTTNPGNEFAVVSGGASQKTITAATVSLSDFTSFFNINGAGAASWSGSFLGNMGGNTGITFPAAKTVYWNLAGSAEWTDNGWAATSGGTPNPIYFPLVQDTAVFDNTGSAGTVYFSDGRYLILPNIDMSARTTAMTFSTSSGGYTAQTIWGNFTAGSGVTFIGTDSFYFSNPATTNLSGSTNAFSQPFIVSGGAVGSVGCSLNISANTTTNNSLSIFNGTFSCIGKTFTCLTIDTNTSSSALNITNSTINLSGDGTVFYGDPATSVVATGSTIAFTNNTTNQKAFYSNGLTFNSLAFGGNTSIANYYISQGSWTGTWSSTKTTAFNIYLEDSQITNVANWTINGSAGNLVGLYSFYGSQATINKTGGGTVNTNYLQIQNSDATPPSATWFAGKNSLNLGNNTGWVFLSDSKFLTLFW